MDTHDNYELDVASIASDLMYENEWMSLAEALEQARVIKEKTFLDISNQQDTEDDE